MRLLSRVFAIDVCAYAIMSSHYHLVLHVDVALARSWCDEVVAQRWDYAIQSPAIGQLMASGGCKNQSGNGESA